MALYTKIKIVLALFLAVILSFLTFTYLKSLNDEVTVVVAAQDIEERNWIKPEMLKEISIGRKEKQMLASNAFTSITELENAISKIRIKKGEVIDSREDVIVGTRQSLLEKKIITENGEINKAYFLSGNKRLITVRLDSHGALNNKLKAGDWVDVIFTSEGGSEKSFSFTILQHIEVFDIETFNGSKGAVQQNITLVVDPQQAVDIAWAKRNGNLDLALNPTEGENEIVFPSNMDKFLK